MSLSLFFILYFTEHPVVCKLEIYICEYLRYRIIFRTDFVEII